MPVPRAGKRRHAMSEVYRWDPDSGSNRDVPDNYICLAQVMKEIAGDDTLKFVLLGKNKQETMFEVSGDGFLVNGEPVTDGHARVYISRYKKNFERFFMEAATKKGTPRTIISRFHIAKLADKAGTASSTINMKFVENGRTVTLGIMRRNGRPAFELDGKTISRDEGEAFIDAHYMDFLIGYKDALAGTDPTKAAAADAKRRTQKQRREAVGISSGYEDGRLKVNIAGILNNEKEKDEMRREMRAEGKLVLSQSFFERKRKGYVPDE